MNKCYGIVMVIKKVWVILNDLYIKKSFMGMFLDSYC